MDSDKEDIEARFYLWKVLAQAKKAPEAAAEAGRLQALAQTLAYKKRLEAIGWQGLDSVVK